MKDLNTTITRFHWQQDEQMLTAMDEQGILAQEELPWWQQPSQRLSPEQKEVAIGMVEKMIEAHYNHPCIYAWGLSNEVWGNQQDLLQFDSVARQLDPTRFTLSMSNHTYRDLDNDASCVLGLPTWNEYTGTWHGKNREELAGRLARLDSALHDRPLFITEAGLCEPAFTGGDATRIDDMPTSQAVSRPSPCPTCCQVKSTPSYCPTSMPAMLLKWCAPMAIASSSIDQPSSPPSGKQGAPKPYSLLTQ